MGIIVSNYTGMSVIQEAKSVNIQICQ